MVPRAHYRKAVETALARSPVCGLMGPRQSGKSTLAREIAGATASHYFDLESPRDQLRLQNPELALGRLSGLVVLDEVQTQPDLFPVLRVLADRADVPARFLILGSAAPELVARSAESLAGRIEYVDLHGFDLTETGSGTQETLWLRGGFPRSYLAASDEASVAWREGFVRTFLERDLPQFGIRVGAAAMRRFWTMLAHMHGQIWNASELGRAMGLSDKTVRNYLDELSQTFMVRQLQPWFENIGKRQVKSPKIYLRDSGILHHLIGLETESQLHAHPKVGSSWEGFALEQVLRQTRPTQAYFWGTQGGAELDLLVFAAGRRLGYEFKYAERPQFSRSMRVAMEDLRLDSLVVICPGSVQATLAPGVEVMGIDAFAGIARP
ncbi:MAG: ATP-binding protein [Planctomycetaceae bacterium]|jgi:predicted AAA+ superfamily ATPase|nr:ATP-binding protein [Planctomycetaceae bacterium]